MRQRRQAVASTPGLELVSLKWGWGINAIVGCVFERVLPNFWFCSTCTANVGTSFIPEIYLQIIAQNALSTETML